MISIIDIVKQFNILPKRKKMCINKLVTFISAVIITFKTLAGHTIDDSLSEPRCYSRFDYDVKMLEAIADLKESEKRMWEKMARLEEVVSRLEDHDKGMAKTVAFMAQLSVNMVIEPLGEVQRPIVFDIVSANTVSAYNKYTGVFTAPYDGSYQFHLDVSSPPQSGAHRLYIHFKKNGEPVGYLFLNDHTQYWMRRSLPVTTHLSKGDAVQAVVTNSHGGKSNIIAGCCLHSTFSGFLVGQD